MVQIYRFVQGNTEYSVSFSTMHAAAIRPRPRCTAGMPRLPAKVPCCRCALQCFKAADCRIVLARCRLGLCCRLLGNPGRGRGDPRQLPHVRPLQCAECTLDFSEDALLIHTNDRPRAQEDAELAVMVFVRGYFGSGSFARRCLVFSFLTPQLRRISEKLCYVSGRI